MIKKRKMFLLVLCLLLTAGCGNITVHVKTDSTAPGSGSEIAADFPMTVTDQAGREVTLLKEPETIVSGYYISTSALIALGLTDRIVGIEAKADRRNIYRLAAPELGDLPNVGSVKEFNLETCAALDPDLAVLPVKLKDNAEILSELGIPVLLVEPENPELLNEMIDLLASVTGTEEKAEKLKQFTEHTKARLSDIGPDMPTVYMGSNSDLLRTSGNSMYQSEMIRLAGGVNAAEMLNDTYWANISYEQLLSWNPDVILIASEASYTPEDVLEDPALQALNAVKNGRVYAMPDMIEAWDSPVPGAVLGSVYVASLIHEEISDAEYKETVKDFYEKFYGFSWDKE